MRGNSLRNSIARGYLYEMRDGLLDELLQCLAERFISAVARANHHKGLDDLPALLVISTDHRAFSHRRMQQQCRFDLGPAML